MSNQWLRDFSLQVGDDGGAGLDFSAFRVAFRIEKKDSAEPNNAVFQVYNVTRETFQKVKKEFTQIRFEAGYKENKALIFKGNVKQVTFARENGTDSILTIAAGDGDEAHNFAICNQTLAAGAKQGDVFDAAGGKMAEFNVESAGLGKDNSNALPRGKVLYGRASDYLQHAAKEAQCDYSIQDGKIQAPENKSLGEICFVLNSRTGLIGAPTETTEGVDAVCLLNPLLKVGSAVQIAQEQIVQNIVGDFSHDLTIEQEQSKNAADGVFRIFSITYEGDSHGQAWFCSFSAIATDESAGE